MTDVDKPMGMMEIADLLGTSYKYVQMMRHRAAVKRREAAEAGFEPDPDLFPVEDMIVSERPLWWASTIEAWAKRTGRI